MYIVKKKREYKGIHHHRSDGSGGGGAIFIIEANERDVSCRLLPTFFFFYFRPADEDEKRPAVSLARRCFVHVFITTDGLLLYVHFMQQANEESLAAI